MNLTHKIYYNKKTTVHQATQIKIPLLHQTHKWKNILCIFVKEQITNFIQQNPSEQPTAANLVKKFSTSHAIQKFMMCFQKPATEPCSPPD